VKRRVKKTLHWRKLVMERRLFGVGLMVLASSFVLMAGTASAHGTVKPQASSGSGTCSVRSLPSFVAQGESEYWTSAEVADVIEVSCNPYVYSDGAEVTLTASQLYDRCNHDLTWYDANDRYGDSESYDDSATEGEGATFNVHLDEDGNANVALIGGPYCMVGESLITVDEDDSPYETFTTSFEVLPSVNTEQGLYITPAAQVEDAESSGVITIAQAEFTGGSETPVRIGAKQLYDRCANEYSPKLNIINMNREKESAPEETDAINLDNNGNGFVILEGDDSCAEGTSLVEADLEESPFTTETATFTVESPRPERLSEAG